MSFNSECRVCIVSVIRDGSDTVLETDEAAEYGGRVANYSREDADDEQGAAEAQPAAEYVRRRQEGEQHLPRKGDKVRHVVARARVGNVAAVHVHRLVELLTPRLLHHADRVQVGVYQIGHLVRNALQIYNNNKIT